MGVGGDRELAREGQDRRGEERETRTVCPNGMEWKEGGRREMGVVIEKKWTMIIGVFYACLPRKCFGMFL